MKKFNVVSKDSIKVVLKASHEQVFFVVCECCNEVVREENTKQNKNGEHICNECIENEYVFCRECEEYVLADDAEHDDCHNNYMCTDCMEYHNYYKCEDCGEITEYIYYVNMDSCDEKNICEDCISNYEYCDHCQQYFTNSNIWGSDDNITICDNCCDNYTTCEVCGEIMNYDNSYYNESDGCNYCEYHYNESIEGDLIHDYSYKPEPVFYGKTSSNDMFLGVELEADRGNRKDETAETINNNLDFSYIKEDGSLDDGLEIVTHPCTLNYHMNQKENYNDTFKAMTQNNWRSHDTNTCGLHVHINRNFFGIDTDTQDLHIAKVMLLVNQLWDNGLVTFTRRQSSELDRWAKRYDMNATQDQEEAVKECKKQYNRYFALNLQNKNTIEFRLYKGSLNTDTFIGTLQFTSNLCRLAKEISISEINKITMQNIIFYETYEELIAYAKTRNLI